MIPANFAMYEKIDRVERWQELRMQNRLLRDRSDPFSLPNPRFVDLFRLSKPLVHYMLERLTPHMRVSWKNDAVAPQLRIFAALSFYATGNYQRSTGQSYLLGMSQQSMSRAIREVTDCIYTELVGEWIKFPSTQREKQNIANTFMENVRFPGTIGAVDCTHVDILCPSAEEHNYVDRRGNHSKNVQIVCDYSTRILSINGRYAGSTHDSFIWRHSRVHTEMEQAFQRGEQYWLLGDSGYPLQPWLMTPILDAAPGSPEDRYTQRHCSARNCIERCNGILKMRFRCILGERKLRYAPDFVGRLVTVCAVLHNMCIVARLENPEGIMIDGQQRPIEMRNNGIGEMLEEGRRVRNNLIVNYFA